MGEEALLVHDEHHAAAEPGVRPQPTDALDSFGVAPVGVFRDVEQPVYDDLLQAQIDEAR